MAKFKIGYTAHHAKPKYFHVVTAHDKQAAIQMALNRYDLRQSDMWLVCVEEVLED